MNYRDFLQDFGSPGQVVAEYWSRHPGSQPDNRDGVTLYSSQDGIRVGVGDYPTREMNEIAAACIYVREWQNKYIPVPKPRSSEVWKW